MATVHIPTENRKIAAPEEVREFLRPFGIIFEQWNVEGRIGADATNEEILEAYAPEIERLKAQHGFVTADVINVNPTTPNLDAMLAKFDKEHLHTEDEVRFTVRGSGVFHINPQTAPVFSITVESGDLISVPRGTHHWFNLCNTKTIRCIRLFEDPSGWTPHYMDQGVHENYSPLCMGPQYLTGNQDIETEGVIQL
jgi:1,2-dihydroxy-3-keto-5-methylthiopentene dioxygenase